LFDQLPVTAQRKVSSEKAQMVRKKAVQIDSVVKNVVL
jgi:hypothetical protein